MDRKSGGIYVVREGQCFPQRPVASGMSIMKSFSSVVALVAVLGTGLPPGLASAQGVSPDLAARLRDAVAQAEPQISPTTGGVSSASFSTSELDHIVAPIALYPDALLAQVLVASTYPDQVSAAGQLISRASGMSDSDLSDAIAAQQWDQSVLVLLSGFPSVVSRMADDMGWTRELGSAVTSDNASVMSAVQRMRSQAAAAGNLVSNRAQAVRTTSSGISIVPADPKVVYVPTYDPETVYTTRNVAYAGPPVETVQSSPGINPFVAGALGFGAGLLVSNLFHHADHHDSSSPPPPPPPPGPWANYWQRDDVIDWRTGGVRPAPGAPVWTSPHGGQMPPSPPPPGGPRGAGLPPQQGHPPAPPPPAQAHGGQPPAHRTQTDLFGTPIRQTDQVAQPQQQRRPPPHQPPQPGPQTIFGDQAQPPRQAHPRQGQPQPGQPPQPQQRAHEQQRPEQQRPEQRGPSPEFCREHPGNQACKRPEG